MSQSFVIWSLCGLGQKEFDTPKSYIWSGPLSKYDIQNRSDFLNINWTYFEVQNKSDTQMPDLK